MVIFDLQYYFFIYFSSQTFLHGHLFIEVREGKDLPDMEGWVSKLVDKGDVTDPYVDVRLGTIHILRNHF